MQVSEVFACLVLGTLSISLYSDGVVVVAAAATPVRVDLGTRANLSCPGLDSVAGSAIVTVSWFVGNDSALPVQLDDGAAVNSRGNLILDAVSRSHAGFYACQYHYAGQTIQSHVQLIVLELYIDMFVVDTMAATFTHYPGVQETVFSVPSSKTIIFVAGVTANGDMRQRDAIWLFRGGNTDIKLPFFCYSGFTTGSTDGSSSELRMSLLSSYWTYSGVYEVHAGQLKASINLTIRNDKAPVRLPTALEQTYAQCDLSFQPRVVTPPSTVAPPTQPTTVPSTTAAPAAPSSRIDIKALPSTPEILVRSQPSPASQTSAPSASDDSMLRGTSPLRVVISDNTMWIAAVAAVGGLVVLIIIIALVYIVRLRILKGANADLEKKIPRSSQINNQYEERTVAKLQALVQAPRPSNEHYELPAPVRIFHQPPTRSPNHIRNDTCGRQSPYSVQSHSLESGFLRHSTDSLDELGMQADLPSRVRAHSEATMLSVVTLQDGGDSRSLAEKYMQPPTSSSAVSQNSSGYLHSGVCTSPKNASSSTLNSHGHQRSNSFNSTCSLLPGGSESPTPSAANIVTSVEGSPAFIHSRMPRTSSVGSRSYGYAPSPLLKSLPSATPRASNCRGTANIVIGHDNDSSLQYQPKAMSPLASTIPRETTASMSVVVESFA